MRTIPATAAESRFGELIDMAQSEPVRIQRGGRDVAVVLSPEEFRRLSHAAEQPSPTVRRLRVEAGERSRLVRQAQEASRALRDDPRERALLDALEELQAENADALRP